VKPVLHLTNWASRKLHRGLRLTIMVMPRAWECGDGAVRVLRPEVADLRAWHNGRIDDAEYQRRFEATMADLVLRGGLVPGTLLCCAGLDQSVLPVPDGATLLCACARGKPCHRRWAAPYLVAAGWRVVLDGAEVAT
jgi:hypothetical protein